MTVLMAAGILVGMLVTEVIAPAAVIAWLAVVPTHVRLMWVIMTIRVQLVRLAVEGRATTAILVVRVQ